MNQILYLKESGNAEPQKCWSFSGKCDGTNYTHLTSYGDGKHNVQLNIYFVISLMKPWNTSLSIVNQISKHINTNTHPQDQAPTALLSYTSSSSPLGIISSSSITILALITIKTIIFRYASLPVPALLHLQLVTSLQ